MAIKTTVERAWRYEINKHIQIVISNKIERKSEQLEYQMKETIMTAYWGEWSARERKWKRETIEKLPLSKIVVDDETKQQ